MIGEADRNELPNLAYLHETDPVENSFDSVDIACMHGYLHGGAQ